MTAATMLGGDASSESIRLLAETSAKDHSQDQPDRVTTFSLALCNIDAALSKLSYAPQTYNNTIDLGEAHAEILDQHLEWVSISFHDVILAWLQNIPGQDQVMLAIEEEFKEVPENAPQCQQVTCGERAWLQCRSGRHRQANCLRCNTLPPNKCEEYCLENDCLETGLENIYMEDETLNDMADCAEPMPHPLDHAIAALKSVAALDQETLLTDHRHHGDLVRAARHIAAAIDHMVELPITGDPHFPIQEYPPYADALTYTVINSRRPAEANPRYIIPAHQ